ncbi:MAG: nucleotidyl transferase AbiEii/AbiGii toxin family protein [Bdellovibrionales bacterium]|nr:nucleotidyl transferase AbiEii/AbiGii toxin family protein [Bdellovibrionales bacterium]
MNSLIQEKLKAYNCQTAEEEKNAITEITQEIALQAFYESKFFEVSGFHGGTALRILHGLRRFSEDLDFALIKPDPSFDLTPFIEQVRQIMASYGYTIRVTGKDKVSSNVRSRFLKEDSIGSLVTFEHQKDIHGAISIKVEVDINPPAGALFETKYVDFPIDFPVKAFDRPSLFAGKSHALLCRKYVKGRDWFDLGWYIAQKTKINFDLLSAAIDQLGPWQGSGHRVDVDWYVKEMKIRINSIDWEKAKKDVERFLKLTDLKSLDLWSKDFFIEKINKLAAYLQT